ncbi:MAG: PHP domain-containing protein, partial [Spirochaeta sp.]|nr:PHP domain-containing protein [Spirochaeta sp.]
REERTRTETARHHAIIAADRGALDYDRDVRPLSRAEEGGSVTERHILYALALRVMDAVTDPAQTSTLLREQLGIETSTTAQERIDNAGNPHRAYDLLGVFKSEFVPQFFVQPGTVECPPVAEITAFAREIGAIPAYSYLGDVGESPTGDKKAQRFEDAYVEELFAALPGLGFQAVTYMPPRNTHEQLKRVQKLAARHGLLEISGVDINSSRQSFHCPEVLQPEFRHLRESTWALVGHEIAASEKIERGLFGEAGPAAGKPLGERIAVYAALGKERTPSGTGV